MCWRKCFSRSSTVILTPTVTSQAQKACDRKGESWNINHPCHSLTNKTYSPYWGGVKDIRVKTLNDTGKTNIASDRKGEKCVRVCVRVYVQVLNWMSKYLISEREQNWGWGCYLNNINNGILNCISKWWIIICSRSIKAKGYQGNNNSDVWWSSEMIRDNQMVRFSAHLGKERGGGRGIWQCPMPFI